MYNLFRALQDILLLKEFEHSDLIRSHFTDELLNRLYKDLTSGLYDHDNGFGKDKVIAVGELLLVRIINVFRLFELVSD